MFEQTVEDNPKKIGIVNPSTVSEPTHLTIVDLVFFDNISALYHTLRVAYEQVPSESKHAFISQGLESWGLSKEQAQLCAWNLLTQNVEDSADFARINAMHVMGSWVRGEQEGAVGSLSWLRRTSFLTNRRTLRSVTNDEYYKSDG